MDELEKKKRKEALFKEMVLDLIKSPKPVKGDSIKCGKGKKY